MPNCGLYVKVEWSTDNTCSNSYTESASETVCLSAGAELRFCNIDAPYCGGYSAGIDWGTCFCDNYEFRATTENSKSWEYELQKMNGIYAPTHRRVGEFYMPSQYNRAYRVGDRLLTYHAIEPAKWVYEWAGVQGEALATAQEALKNGLNFAFPDNSPSNIHFDVKCVDTPTVRTGESVDSASIVSVDMFMTACQNVMDNKLSAEVVRE